MSVLLHSTVDELLAEKICDGPAQPAGQNAMAAKHHSNNATGSISRAPKERQLRDPAKSRKC
eukprot:12076544-Alexandrium_andersonii.AAC.1